MRRPPAQDAPSPQETSRKNTPVERLRLQHCKETLLALRDHQDLSRQDLCRLTLRSATTLTKVMADLLRYGWVIESEVARGQTQGLGRPSIALNLVPESLRVLTLVVMPDAIHSAVAGLDLSLAHIKTHKCPVSQQSTDATLQVLVSIVQAEVLQAQKEAASPLRAVSIVLPGTTDSELRISLRSPFLGWQQFALADALAAQIHLPVTVHNNTRAMALAEFRHLKLHSDAPLLFVQARFGLGAALLNTATPSRSGHYGVSELGSLPFGANHFSPLIPTDGTLGSVTKEAYLREVLSLSETEPPVIPFLEEACARQETVALLLYEQTLDNLARGLSIAVNLLQPKVIVLGGIYAKASDAFMGELWQRIQTLIHEDLRASVRLQTSALAQSGALEGAAIIGFDRLLQDPLTYHPC